MTVPPDQIEFVPVKLEFLRPGPRGNQLLSPLTPYIALCADQAPATVHLRWEHKTWARTVGDLRYRSGIRGWEQQERRAAALELVQDEVTHLLEQVPALLSELAGERPIHLRMVVTPMELAMLPFEAALAPRGMPREGERLALDPRRKVVVTREVRTGAPADVVLPEEVNVLFVTADPAGMGIPAEQHLLALARTLQPWAVDHPSMEGPGQSAPSAVPEVALRDHRGQPLLSVLQNASWVALRDATGAREYTHVHILAHGAELDDGSGWGLALHQGPELHVVDGATLARALRSRIGHGGPTYVTLATCDSGAAHDVVFNGTSLAHALHVAGIPFVVASQFPLTKRGSILFSERFYDRLFAGWNPLWCFYEGRQLLTGRQHNHDWLSVVAYSRLPDDLDAQCSRVWLARIQEQIWAASATWDHKLADAFEVSKRIHAALGRLETWKAEAGHHLETPDRLIELYGRWGGALRRLAEIKANDTQAQSETKHQIINNLLLHAQEMYKNGIRIMPQHAWTTGQAIGTLAIADVAPDDYWRALWEVAWQSNRPKDRSILDKSSWELANLVELACLGVWIGKQADQHNELGVLRTIVECCMTLLRRASTGDRTYEVCSRQLHRYTDIWDKKLSHKKESWVNFLTVLESTIDMLDKKHIQIQT